MSEIDKTISSWRRFYQKITKSKDLRTMFIAGTTVKIFDWIRDPVFWIELEKIFVFLKWFLGGL